MQTEKSLQNGTSDATSPRRRGSRALLSVGLILGLVTGAAAQQPAVPELARAASTLPAGKVRVELAPFPGSSIRMGRSLGVIDAPADRVAAILEDYENYYRFMPHFRASKVLSRRGSSALVYMEAAAAHGAITLWVQMKLKAETLPDQTRVITGKFVKGNVTTLHAIWKVAPLDTKRSAVSFEVLLDPDLPLPDSMIDNENEKAARQSMKALRKIATAAASAG